MADLIIERAGAVVRLILNRPQVRNAFDEALIAALTTAYTAYGADPAVRAIVLQAVGPVFCAGADLDWMRRAAAYEFDRNRADALDLAGLMRAIDRCPKPTVVRIQGPAYAGALGLIAASDLAIASTDAHFCISETRIGLIPAVIGPYLVRAIGARATRQLALTAELFDAPTALRLGLVHQCVPAGELDAMVERKLDMLAANSPAAQAATKALLRTIAGDDAGQGPDTIGDAMATAIATQRASADGQAGIAAFLAKRPPPWAPDA